MTFNTLSMTNFNIHKDPEHFNWTSFVEHLKPLEVLKGEDFVNYLESNRLAVFSGIRVLLLPPAYARNESEPSIGLIKLASLLSFLGACCEIFPLTDDNANKLFSMVNNGNYFLIGVSTTHYTFDNDIKRIREIRRNDANVSIVIGGHGTEVPVTIKRKVFNYVDIDCFINGLGEKPLVDYIYAKLCKVPISFPGIDTSDRISGTKAVYTEKEYNLFGALYNPSFYPKHIDTLYVTTSSHCPMKCVFCSSRNFPGHAMRRVSHAILENVLFRFHHQLPCLKNISFYDDNFSSPYYSEVERRKYLGQEWVDKFCQIINKNNWKYNYNALFRIDTIDYETIDNLANSGFKKVSFGIEHTDKNILLSMKKNISISPGQTINKIKYIIDKGMDAELFFIIFSKWETWDSITKLVYDICDYVTLGALIIYNWGLQALYGSDLMNLNNTYLKDSNHMFVDNTKVVPDDKIIAEWFLLLNSNRDEFFRFQDNLELDIYKEYCLAEFKNFKLFNHIQIQNLNSSTTFRNLIRILSMFLWGQKYLSEDLDWDTVINVIRLTILRYAYRNVIKVLEQPSSEMGHENEFAQIVEIIKNKHFFNNLNNS